MQTRKTIFAYIFQFFLKKGAKLCVCKCVGVFTSCLQKFSGNMSSSLLFIYYNCCFYFFHFSLATRRFELLAMRFSSTVSFPYYYYHGWMTIHISIAYYYIILQYFFALFFANIQKKSTMACFGVSCCQYFFLFDCRPERERRGANKHVCVLSRFSFGGGRVGGCNGDLCISRENCSRMKTIVTIQHLQFFRYVGSAGLVYFAYMVLNM